jgi:hypothetical protein
MTEVATKPAEKSARILNPQRMGLAEHLRQDWVVNAEEGTTISEVLDPQYWSHMAAVIQPYARIEVRLETGEWVAELMVVNVGRNWAQVSLLVKHDLEARSENPVALKHKVEWKGPQKKHVVIRIADSMILQEGFSEKSKAIEWMVNHEQVTLT